MVKKCLSFFYIFQIINTLRILLYNICTVSKWNVNEYKIRYNIYTMINKYFVILKIIHFDSENY